ncbi:uncharacterized protein LOC143817411 isoform X2 [Ranitomeya variabilis]|uniref:uncharacterized protein LOC143817411 isoform X2 n=1 Tax=Ranitomeya variabilis TaxID=490064 RepID=UPI0040562D05
MAGCEMQEQRLPNATTKKRELYTGTSAQRMGQVQDPRRAGYTLLFPPVARPKTSGGESPDRQPHPAWLSCPRDRSRQLRVELQLDRACHIGYIDIGNSGSAFLQIDVGRSIWALDKGFTTLLPTTTLMPPADARLMKNHRGVRMFKEGDFLAGAALEKWDRVTCTQPFNKQEQFGLSFIRVLSTPDEEDEERLEGSGGGCSCPVSPLHSGEQPTLDAQDPEARYVPAGRILTRSWDLAVCGCSQQRPFWCSVPPPFFTLQLFYSVVQPDSLISGVRSCETSCRAWPPLPRPP